MKVLCRGHFRRVVKEQYQIRFCFLNVRGNRLRERALVNRVQLRARLRQIRRKRTGKAIPHQQHPLVIRRLVIHDMAKAIIAANVARRKKLAAEIEKTGILFESKKIKEAQLPAFISSYMKRKGIDMEPKATAMLADFVGTDLSRLTGELEKLIITLPGGQKRVTPEQIEKNIGISKDYNNFELRSALVEKDVLKANKIIKYFEENPKTNPIQMTLSLLFNFYSNLMLAYYAPDKSEQGVATMLGLKTPWQARDYLTAMRKYTGVKTMQIVGEIRYADAKSKGVGNTSISDGDILRELVFKILH